MYIISRMEPEKGWLRAAFNGRFWVSDQTLGGCVSGCDYSKIDCGTVNSVRAMTDGERVDSVGSRLLEEWWQRGSPQDPGVVLVTKIPNY